jgi:hypothetical protein
MMLSKGADDPGCVVRPGTFCCSPSLYNREATSTEGRSLPRGGRLLWFSHSPESCFRPQTGEATIRASAGYAWTEEKDAERNLFATGNVLRSSNVKGCRRTPILGLRRNFEGVLL